MKASITAWITRRPARNEIHAKRQQVLDMARTRQAAGSFTQATRGT